MNYISQINAFERWLETNHLSVNAQLLWYKLMYACSRAGWPEWLRVDNIRLMSLTGIDSRNTFIRCRNDLIEVGRVEVQKGKRGSPGAYRIIPFEEKDSNFEQNMTPKTDLDEKKGPISCSKNEQNMTHKEEKGSTFCSNFKQNMGQKEEIGATFCSNFEQNMDPIYKNKNKQRDIINLNSTPKINSNLDLNKKASKDYRLDNNTPSASSLTAHPPEYEIPLKDGTVYIVTENDVETFQQLYPGTDTKKEFRGMVAWCLANPTRRKTRAGVKRFINGWLSRSQDHIPDYTPAKPQGRVVMLKEWMEERDDE